VKAVAFAAFGPPSVLEVRELPDPAPGPGEVLIRVRACGVNHLDLDLRAGVSGFPVRFPHVPGIEVAGEVAAVGPGVAGVRVADRVLVIRAVTCGTCTACLRGDDNLCAARQTYGVDRPGGYADYVLAPARNVVVLPPALGFEEAAAIQVAFSTAWFMLVERARVRPGETVLIVAGGSGVGSAAVQIARHAGARVLATAGAAWKLARLRDLGIHATLDHGQPDWPDAVRRLTDGAGVDLVFEHVGGETLTRALGTLRRGGRLVTCGAHGGERITVDVIDLFRRQLAVMGSYSAPTRAVTEVVRLVAAGVLRSVIHDTLPLHDAARAHEILAGREAFGKLVLVSG
jgi:NADPH:quinone reductase-like Zn-dependent oxidoreductase